MRDQRLTLAGFLGPKSNLKDGPQSSIRITEDMSVRPPRF